MQILVLGEERENEENCYPDSNLGDGIDTVKSIRAKHDSRVACESFYVDNGAHLSAQLLDGVAISAEELNAAIAQELEKLRG